MTTLDDRLAALAGFFPLTEENVETVLSEIEAVTANGDRRTVGPILLMADENCELEGVTGQMLKMLETVPVEEYVEELLAVLPRLVVNSPSVAEHEVEKLLWSPADRAVLGGRAAGLGRLQEASLRTVLGSIRAAALQPAVAELEAVLDSPAAELSGRSGE